ncbi:hypothetical protein NA56DRAFT_648347 [Hyaloscypha hepaticicola]|uniref:Mid2 domain-containing protein n=1 Tax=Hyaloscypha hepaticicola TaxID=2082293 RepID=A0A2J6PV71_9HELO|nr:hypothetical protein NA56DRAFT_648347 [Hyaloscypha hepaticicola]
MSSFIKQIFKTQLAICLFTSTVASIATFTSPSSDSTLTLTVGEPYLIEWENAGSDYSELSLGLLADANGNDLWLLSNQFGYTAENYQWSAVTFGSSGIIPSQGPFRFILVNGTSFGLESLSTTFSVVYNSSDTTTSSSATATGTSTPTPTVTVTTAPTTSHSSAASSSSSSGLSAGAKAGIGVGVAVAAIFTISALFFFFIRRYRRANQEHNLATSKQLTYDKPELSGEPKTRAELSGEHNGLHGINELDNENHARIHEAP